MLSGGIVSGTRSRPSGSDLSSEEDDDPGKASRGGMQSQSWREEIILSPHRASPSKRTASRASIITVSQRKAAQDCDLRRREAQNLCTSGESSSSESEEQQPEDSFDSTPKKRPKPSSSAGKQRAKTVSMKSDVLFNFGKSESLLDYGDALRQSQEQNQARLAEMDRALTASSQSGSSGSEVPRRVKDLSTCPFCYEPMPESKSKYLKDLMQPWLDQYHQRKHIGVTSTVEACQRHRDEARTIPEGRLKGWKIKLSESRLKAIVKNEKNPFMSVMRQRIEDPSSSEWFNRIVAARKKYGRLADSTSAQMQNLGDMHAGYYGEQGKEVLQNTLCEIFIDYPQPEYDLTELSAIPDGPLQHLNPLSFVERVLLPELIILLIVHDQKARNRDITVEEAKAIRDDSVDYGIAMFPSKALGPAVGGRNAFGDNGKSPSASGSGSKTTASHVEIKTAKKVAKTAQSPFSSKVSPASQVVARKDVKPRAKVSSSLPTQPLPPPSQQVASRPRPRPAARKAGSETASTISDPSRIGEGNQHPLTSPDMNGDDLDTAIDISPKKETKILEPISIPSSYESITPQASQESIQASRYDSPGSLPHRPKFSPQEWRSGYRAAYD